LPKVKMPPANDNQKAVAANDNKKGQLALPGVA
jgi:hypothetical protein